MGFTAFLLYSTLNTLSFHSNTHTLTLDWICPQYLPCMQDPPYHLLPHARSPLLPESFANLSSRPRSDWQQHQIPLVTKIIEARFDQAVTDCPRANANSDLLSVRYDVRSGTRSSVVHASSLHGCLIRSVWATHSHGNQSVKRDRESKGGRTGGCEWLRWLVTDAGRSEWGCSTKEGADGWTGFNEFDNVFLSTASNLSYILSEHQSD